MRNRKRVGLFVLIFMTVSLLNTVFAAEVYVVSDGYKIMGDGNIVEFDNKPPGKLKESNAIWNGAKKEINIAGAKNEVVAFQVVIAGSASNLTFGFTPSKGADALPSEAVSFHLVAYVFINGKYYPDVVIPLTWKDVSPFSVPYSLAGFDKMPNQEAGVVMVEVKIPKGLSAGNYTGEISIAEGGAGKTRGAGREKKVLLNENLKVNLKVWDFELPSKPSIVFDFNSYNSPVEIITKDNKNQYAATSEETIEAEHNFYRSANLHRCFLNIMPVHSQRGTPYYTPALSGKGANVKCDWTNWDKRFKGVLDGSIFEDKEPVPYFYLPFNLHWPWGYTHDSSLKDRRLNWRKDPDLAKDHTKIITQEYLDEWKEVAKQYVEHFSKEGWKKTSYQVYFNHTDAENANSPWRLDEPYDRWGFQVLAYYANLTHKVFKNNLDIDVKYRLDIGHFYCNSPTIKCYKPKLYDLPLSKNGGGVELLEPAIDTFYVGLMHAYGNRDKVLKLEGKKYNKEMFIYGGGQQITDGATTHRALFWYFYDLQLKGYCAWNQGCDDPGKRIEGNGANHVWYSGKNLGFSGPVPSFRMKLWRRSSFDAEFLLLAEKKSSREKVMKIFKNFCDYKKSSSEYKLVDLPDPGNNPEDYEIARLKLASIILGTGSGEELKFNGRISGPPQKTVDQITGY